MALLPVLFCACSSFNEENTYSTPIVSAATDLRAGFAEETRIYVENNKYLRWHEDDRLTAFYGNTLNRQYKFNGKTGANSGTFSLVPSGELGTGNAFDRIYAIYPYNETATITDEGELSLTLPAVQNYAENSFGKGANTMIAATENLEDTFLAFKNTCGYLKLKLYDIDGGELKSIEIKGNNGEKIAGSATATIEFGGVPQLTMEADATTTIILDCGDGIAIGQTPETATEFWVVIPETTFTKGLTIKVTDSEGGVFEKSTDKEVVITRNEIQPMKVVEAVLCAPESWKIRYTATAIVNSASWTENTFGASIVSNEWDETSGKGVITLDGEVSKIESRAFFDCGSLTSVTIPESVTSIGNFAFYGCTGLTSITIPDKVKKIEQCVIPSSKSSLTSIIIGKSVTSIDYCFSPLMGFSEFTEVYCKALTPPQINAFIFDSNYLYCGLLSFALKVKLYVPRESYELYVDCTSHPQDEEYLESYLKYVPSNGSPAESYHVQNWNWLCREIEVIPYDFE